MRQTLLPLTIGLLVAAPAAAVDYFESFQIKPGLYRVSYQGNAYQSERKVEKALHCKAAKLTIKDGYSHFTLMPPEHAEDHSYHGSSKYGKSGASAAVYYHTFHKLVALMHLHELDDPPEGVDEAGGITFDAKVSAHRWKCKGAKKWAGEPQ